MAGDGTRKRRLGRWIASVVVAGLAFILVRDLIHVFDHAALTDFEAFATRAQAMKGQPAASALSTLDGQFAKLDYPRTKRIELKRGTNRAQIEHETRRMSWSPPPPLPQDEDVVAYIVLWKALFIYIGPDGTVTRVVKCAT